MAEDLDFTSAHLLEEVSLDIIHTIPQAMLCAFFALKGAPNITSLKYASSTIVTLSFQKYPDALALFKRLKVVGIKDCISASRALDIIRICESAERIHIHATRGMDGLEPTITASSKKLSILELTISTDEAGDMLGHLHLPHLKVLSVRCLNTGGFELARVISKLVGDRSRHTLQVLALDNISFDALEDLVVVQGLSRIPIVQFRLLTRQSHGITINECVKLLPERIKKWEVEIDSRMRVCALSDTGYLVFAVGWVDSEWYEEHRWSLPCDIFDNLDIDRFLD